ncbi:MAG: diguanylate cyclase [Candidatus Omnitrophica bacterium]|nr:diguanylate cyclase [Candidatus Omnitrophota bacterium]MDD5430163.1 diguanylate cyclase [Candidatus Omnitrophota bacterium]
MDSITLKNRIITLLVIFTILTISVFVAIQLYQALYTVNRYKEREAQVVSLVLENTWDKLLTFPLTEDKKIELLGKKITSLKKSQTISAAYVFDRKGNIVFLTRNVSVTEKDCNDDAVIEKIDRKEGIENLGVIDRQQKLLSIYVLLAENEEVKFIAKVYFSLADIWEVLGQVYMPAFSVGAMLIFLNILLGLFLSHLIVRPIKILNEAAKRIASGRLDLKINIHTNDEIQELSESFNFMTRELVKMKDKAENANPLTKLPGNIVIMEIIEERIKQNKKFVVIYGDLDNFKAFNDKYGILKGDEAIKLTADIFKKAIQEKGTPEDFIGHEGGDDFIVLTTPDTAQAVASYVMKEFNSKIRSLYDKTDLDNNYIISSGRDGAVNQFPIMTVSMAGVTNAYRQIKNYAEVTNIAAELKKKAKNKNESCFVLDERKS